MSWRLATFALSAVLFTAVIPAVPTAEAIGFCVAGVCVEAEAECEPSVPGGLEGNAVAVTCVTSGSIDRTTYVACGPLVTEFETGVGCSSFDVYVFAFDHRQPYLHEGSCMGVAAGSRSASGPCVALGANERDCYGLWASSRSQSGADEAIVSCPTPHGGEGVCLEVTLATAGPPCHTFGVEVYTGMCNRSQGSIVMVYHQNVAQEVICVDGFVP